MSSQNSIRFDFIKVASSTEIGQFVPVEMSLSNFSNASGSLKKTQDLEDIEKLGRKSAKEMIAAFAES